MVKRMVEEWSKEMVKWNGQEEWSNEMVKNETAHWAATGQTQVEG